MGIERLVSCLKFSLLALILLITPFFWEAFYQPGLNHAQVFQGPIQSGPYLQLYDVKQDLKVEPFVLYPATDGTVWIVAFSVDESKIVRLSPGSGLQVYLTMKEATGFIQDIVVDHGGGVWFPQN